MAGEFVADTMTYQFGPCELDEGRRLLLANGNEIKLQPRVFDLLCYLVRHRERVVTKDELLDALWPGTVVVDNALQRVVSLARSALSDVGMDDAVRTYSRHGYRFCVEDCIATIDQELSVAEATVQQARDAYERNDWIAACDAYASAEARGELTHDDIEQWGRAAICAGLGQSTVPALERVVSERDTASDEIGAARATLLLVQIRIDSRQGAMARGLLQRVSRYLDGKSASAERGHYAWMSSRSALGSGDADTALALADEACRVGRSLRDADVECLGLVYRGHSLIAQGKIAAGLSQHEEAAAVIRLGAVRSWVAGWALCSILYAARYRCDWLRAAQFAEAFFEWSRSCSMPAFPGTCQLHRAAVLSVRGDLERAASEVRAAAELLARAAPWAEGDAYCVLGEIQLSCGDFESAEASFKQANALGWDPQPGLARLHLLTGRPELALRGLERALEEADWTLLERRAQLLCMVAQAAAVAGNLDRAREALTTIAAQPQLIDTEALKAMHCTAEAEVAMRDGDVAVATQRLRRAVRHWREIDSRVCEAETRLRLAECLLQDNDAAGAELELHALESTLAPATIAHRDRVGALREMLNQMQSP